MTFDDTPTESTYQAAWAKHSLSFTQSWQWADAKGGTSNPVRLIVGGVPVTVFVRKLPGIGGQFGYIPRGFSDESAKPRRLKETSELICSKLGLSHLVIEPNVCAPTPIDPRPWREAGFVLQTDTVQPRYSNHIDVTKTDEELTSGMEHDARRRLKQALARDDLSVREDSTETGLEQLYSTIHGVSRRSKFVLQQNEYFVRVFRAFAFTESSHLLFVYREKELLYATFALEDNAFLRRLYGGPTEAGRKEPAGHLLLWESVKLARKLGLEKIDLWGVAPYGPDGFEKRHSMYGISKFKASFGGENVTYLPQLIWVRDRGRFQAYRAMMKTHRGLIKLRKLLR